MRDTTFIIQIPKLREGKNLYEWQLGEAYFQARPHAFIRNGNLKVVLEVDKNVNMLDLQFKVDGSVASECDRCTDPIQIPVHNQSGMIVKMLEEGGTSDDQVLFLGKHDNEVPVDDMIYDLIMTSVPMRVLCEMEVPPKACNAEVLKSLEKNSGQSTESDERWEALKKLKPDSSS